MHAVVPVLSLNFPAAQGSHVLPPPPGVYPLLHMQSSIVSLDPSEKECVGQFTHSELSEDEYVLTLQLRHASDEFAPATGENFPAGHCMQVLAPVSCFE